MAKKKGTTSSDCARRVKIVRQDRCQYILKDPNKGLYLHQGGFWRKGIGPNIETFRTKQQARNWVSQHWNWELVE